MLKRFVIPEQPPQIFWLIDELVPQGFVSLIFGRQGQGKTALAAFLAVQAARPAGRGTFANRSVASGWSLILDADDATGTTYALWLNKFFRQYPDAERDAISVRLVENGLETRDLERLKKEFRENPPLLLVVDAFSSAFPGLDMIRPHLAFAPVRALSSLAAELGTTVLLLDHVGKTAPGQRVAEKGPIGSTAKLFSPRAAFAMERVEPKDCEGRSVFRLECVKQSFAAVPPPLGLELVLLDAERADFRPYALPDVVTLEQRAELVILDIVRGSPAGIPRKELLAQVVVKANVSERTAARALAGLVKRQTVVLETIPGPGAPALVKLALPPVVPGGLQ